MIPAPLLARVLRNGAKGRGKRNSTVSGSTTTTSNPSGKGSAGPWLMRIKRSKVYFTARSEERRVGKNGRYRVQDTNSSNNNTRFHRIVTAFAINDTSV